MITFLMRPAMWPVLTEEVIWSSPLTRDPWLCEAVFPRWFADEGQFVPSSDDGQLVPKQQCTEQLQPSVNQELVVDAEPPKRQWSQQTWRHSRLRNSPACNG